MFSKQLLIEHGHGSKSDSLKPKYFDESIINLYTAVPLRSFSITPKMYFYVHLLLE